MPLSDESFDLIYPCVERTEIKKNEIIMTQGKSHPSIYIIRKGIVRGYTVTCSGLEDTNSFWMEDETFGDVKSYIANNPVSKTYIALEDLIVYKVDKEKFRQLFFVNLELANLGRLMVENFVFRSDHRQLILSEQKPMQKYLKFCALRKGVHARVKLKYIASYLQITPETLSRVRSSF